MNVAGGQVVRGLDVVVLEVVGAGRVRVAREHDTVRRIGIRRWFDDGVNITGGLGGTLIVGRMSAMVVRGGNVVVLTATNAEHVRMTVVSGDILEVENSVDVIVLVAVVGKTVVITTSGRAVTRVVSVISLFPAARVVVMVPAG